MSINLDFGIEYIIFGIVRFLVIVPMFISAVKIIRYVQSGSLIRKGMMQVYNRVNRITIERENNEKEIRQIYGNSKQKGLLNKFEQTLRYSGLLRGAITFEVVIILLACVELVAFMCAWMMTKNIYQTVVTPVAIWLVINVAVNNVAGLRYKNIDKEMLPMLNMVSSYCLITDNLVKILEGTANNVGGTIGKELSWAVNKIKTGSPCSDVLKELEINSPHQLFKTLIRNLEMASRNSSNYIDVVEELREMLEIVRENEKKMEIERRNGRITVLMLVVSGLVCIAFISEGIANVPLNKIISVMTNDSVGTAILIYLTVVAGASLVYAISDKGGVD